MDSINIVPTNPDRFARALNAVQLPPA